MTAKNKDTIKIKLNTPGTIIPKISKPDKVSL